MSRFLLGRLGAGLVTVFVSTLVVFAIVRFIPGDPVSAQLAQGGLSPEAQEALRSHYGLDHSIPVQYLTWMGSILHGDFGSSFLTQEPVVTEVASRISRTIYLAAAGILVALAVAVPAAIASARYAGRRADVTIATGVSVLISIPNFIIGILLIVVFAVQLRIFPVAGYVDPTADLGTFFQSMVLPALTIGLPASAVIARVLRSSLLDEMRRDYVRTAEARGSSRMRTIVRHGLRNASIPTVTIVGLQVGYLLGGAFVVELLFTYPGVGLLLLNSITQRDYPTIQACLLFFAVAFVIVNLITDILYAVLNPRLKVQQ
ncbi:ABC transporter permease [Amycolatopsis tucumanensis]|uniref:ABC transporter permease n=1 Tax=Amycolatopsis tucumanensis TaxID=401106 RepID=A0ABP7I5P8_9PSEU|nr:ABC transporter permease [Amycolatopsis tucumanensis]MCF6426194.1 ABC transporter permease [Amycolatopsis tucumanensis]